MFVGTSFDKHLDAFGDKFPQDVRDSAIWTNDTVHILRLIAESEKVELSIVWDMFKYAMKNGISEKIRDF